MSLFDFTRNSKKMRKLTLAQFGVVAVVMVIVLTLVVDAMKGPAPPTDPEIQATLDPLSATFEALAFGPLDAPLSERLRKWSGRVRIALDENTASLADDAGRLAGELSALSGLKIALAGVDERAGLIVTSAEAVPGGCRLVFDPPDGGIIERATLTLDAGLGPEQQRACLTTGLARALGLPGTSDILVPSLFAAGDNAATELSATDRLMIEMLYDARLRPGMVRERANAKAREAFIGLFRE
jgi:hypothetical protein